MEPARAMEVGKLADLVAVEGASGRGITALSRVRAIRLYRGAGETRTVEGHNPPCSNPGPDLLRRADVIGA